MDSTPSKKQKLVAGERFNLRLTAERKKKLGDIANKANLSMTDVIIRFIDNIEIKESLTDEDRKMLYSLGRNFNQLLKFAHQGNFSEESILEIVQDIKFILKSRK